MKGPWALGLQIAVSAVLLVLLARQVHVSEIADALSHLRPITVLGALALTAALVPLVIRLARRTGFLDVPGPRKIHAQPMPYGGGFAVAAGFFACAAPDLDFYQRIPPPKLFNERQKIKNRMFIGTNRHLALMQIA